MNRIRATLEITDTGEDLDALPCLFALEIDGNPFLLLGESARPLGIPSHDASYSAYALFEGVQAMVLTLLADHRELTDPDDPHAAPLFVADCGMDCCGFHDFSVQHRDGRVVLHTLQGAKHYVLDPANYAEAVTSAVGGFLKLATSEQRLRDDDAWHLYDHLAWLLRKAAHDGIPGARSVCRRFLDEAEEQIQRATHPVPEAQGTH
ncbi:MAG: hypothetical protein QN163_02690 [Armatimonadota bacterium]|nr:hypothetical protein [Armatimonadota bacterium]MDR5696902.1 hypothetical protein [Armatimonadota bacterium]